MAQVMGITHIRDGIEPQSILGVDMAIIGIIGTAPEANGTLIPYDTPIELRTNDTTLRAALGTTGTIVDALIAISAQLTDAAAKCVIVRVEDDDDVDEVIANIVGSEAQSTGMWALLDAPEELGVTPRLIIAPGYTSQTIAGVESVTVTNMGTGYTTAPTITPTGGGTDPDKVLPTFAAVLGTGSDAGKVVSITVLTPGAHLTAPPALGFTGGGGSGAAATAVLGVLANSVCANIPTIISRLRAKFLPEGPTSSQSAAETWIETLPRDMNFLHPLRQNAKEIDANGDVVEKPLSPYIIALYARRDAEFDGMPGRSIANQSINGLVGVTPRIRLDITNDTSEGMEDIENHFGIVVRGEIGVDGSLTDGGFTFWGTDTLSPLTEWQFANVVRLRDYIEINQIKAIRNYLGRFNLTIQTVQAIANTMDSELSKLRADNHIIDYRIDFLEDLNTPEDLRQGFLTIAFRAEEPAPLRKVTVRSRRYREALTEMVQNISIQLGSAVV